MNLVWKGRKIPCSIIAVGQSISQWRGTMERKLRAEWKTDGEKCAADKVLILFERVCSWATDGPNWNPETTWRANSQNGWLWCGAKFPQDVSTCFFLCVSVSLFLVSSASLDVTAGDAQSGGSLSGPRWWWQGRTPRPPHHHHAPSVVDFLFTTLALCPPPFLQFVYLHSEQIQYLGASCVSLHSSPESQSH